MSRSKQLLGLDIGHKRVGVAVADTIVRIAVPCDALEMDETTFRKDVADLVTQHDIQTIVVGYPRNQSGEATAQTSYVESMASQLDDIDATVTFQDESLTSVEAERRLQGRSNITKGEIDSEAASIILQDYMEQSA